MSAERTRRAEGGDGAAGRRLSRRVDADGQRERDGGLSEDEDEVMDDALSSQDGGDDMDEGEEGEDDDADPDVDPDAEDEDEDDEEEEEPQASKPAPVLKLRVKVKQPKQKITIKGKERDSRKKAQDDFVIEWQGEPLRKAGGRTYYSACEFEGYTFRTGSCVALASGEEHEFFAKINSLFEIAGDKSANVQWFVPITETCLGPECANGAEDEDGKLLETRELVLSTSRDINPIASFEHPVQVKFVGDLGGYDDVIAFLKEGDKHYVYTHCYHPEKKLFIEARALDPYKLDQGKRSLTIRDNSFPSVVTMPRRKKRPK